MKSFLSLTSVAASAAFFVLPISAEFAISLSFVAGFALVLTADYGRRLNSLPCYCTASRSRESLRLAA
jgi:hypothetical protein